MLGASEMKHELACHAYTANVPLYRIFEHAIKALGVEKPSQIVFLDDLGGNLRTAKEMGFNTIKVALGDTRGAIQQLEAILAEDLSSPAVSKL